VTVSIEKTSRKYRGKMASGYEAKRKKQIRWHEENRPVEQMMSLQGAGTTLLDCPVGTGRFLKTWEKMGFRVLGIDASEEMLALARRKRTEATLVQGSALDTRQPPKSHHAVVCVRFLDLIDEEAMRGVMRELARVAIRRIALTIRLGEKYVPKSNTATHDEKKFRRLVSALGFVICDELPIFKAGWRVMRLERKGNR